MRASFLWYQGNSTGDTRIEVGILTDDLNNGERHRMDSGHPVMDNEFSIVLYLIVPLRSRSGCEVSSEKACDFRFRVLSVECKAAIRKNGVRLSIEHLNRFLKVILTEIL